MNAQEQRVEERAQSRGRSQAKQEHLPHPGKARGSVLITGSTRHALTVELEVNNNQTFRCGISMFEILHRNTYTRKQFHPVFLFAKFGNPTQEVSEEGDRVGHTWESRGQGG